MVAAQSKVFTEIPDFFAPFRTIFYLFVILAGIKVQRGNR